MTTITSATLSDVDAIAKLVNSAYRGEHAKKGWTTEAFLIDGSRTDATALTDIIKNPDTTILKYLVDEVLSAVVELKKVGSKLYLGMLTVEPSIQNGGIGKKLLAAAEDFGKNNGCTAVFMNVITHRKELIDWYVRHGYSDTGTRKPFLFNDDRFGRPKEKLEFMILEKKL